MLGLPVKHPALGYHLLVLQLGFNIDRSPLERFPTLHSRVSITEHLLVNEDACL